jgi:hypothetical protein
MQVQILLAAHFIERKRMTTHPDLVPWRLRHGSFCAVCPLNGQRKVGADGPIDAEHIIVLDMPTKDDAQLGVSFGYKYGRPARSGAAYYWKLENLVPAGIATIHQRPGKVWPNVELTNAQVLNVTMCNNPADPKGKKPESKAARRCCANSLRAFLRTRRNKNPNISIHPCGGPALTTVMQTKVAIDSYRGRFVGNVHGEPLGPTNAEWARMLTDEPEGDIIKYVLRGKHPREEWWPDFELWWKGFRKLYRKTERALVKQAVLDATPAEVLSWTKVYKQQVAKAKRLQKGCNDASV